MVKERLSGIGEHRGDKETKEHVVTFAPLKWVPWGIVLEKPKEELLELPWALVRLVLIASGAGILVATALIWGFTRQVISPIRRLSAAAETFGTGKLEVEVPPMGQDEIGRLAQSFEIMRSRLKHSLEEIHQWNQELEQRVRERTIELERLYQQLRQRDDERGDLLAKIITAQEEERRRIARELHDQTSHSLTSLMIGLKMAEAQAPEEMSQSIINLKQLSSQALEQVHKLATELRPSSLDDLGLVVALRQLTDDYSRTLGIDTDFQAYGLESKRLPPEVEIAIYRVVQEALTNVAKHAEAKAVSILLETRGTSLVAIVEDNGKGFDVDRVLTSGNEDRRLGLYGMQERTSLIGGTLTIESMSGRG
ncbi:MAG: HAMP domain-containing protein, partial [Chloroflexi bacterium]|nr:HAMP domain-containing protein [Chloroflexota bacterium]